MVNKPSTALFTSDTRPKALRELYEAAAIVAVRSLDSLRRDGSSMDMFLCTPVLGKRRRDQSLDIESRIVSVIILLAPIFGNIPIQIRPLSIRPIIISLPRDNRSRGFNETKFASNKFLTDSRKFSMYPRKAMSSKVV